MNRQSLFKDRLVFCISFLQSVGQYSCVYGSMIRKMFELIFHLQNVDSNNHVGDILNSDINILFNLICIHLFFFLNLIHRYKKFILDFFDFNFRTFFFNF